MLEVLWSAIQREQTPPDLAPMGSILNGNPTDSDAGLRHGDSTIRPDWWV
jgi:hypothetical protein